jgi:cytochrome P450
VTDSEVTVPPVFDFDTLLRPEFSRSPQPYYKHMRDTNPVLRTSIGQELVFVAKYDDIDHVLHDAEVYSCRYGANVETRPMIPINIDPPDHAKWRKLLDPLFSPREMAKLEEKITRRVNDLIDAFIERGSCDYAAEFAVPLPCEIFMDLLGLPLEETEEFLEMKEHILRGGGGAMMMEQDEVRTTALAKLFARFERLIEDRRREPQDDVLTKMIHGEVEGRPLTQDELLGICQLMFIAGLDTVTDSLTCFYAFLGRNPEYRARLATDPEIIPRAIEEMLLYESPVPFVPRIAAKESELSGCPVKPGDMVLALLGSANTDEHQLADANVVNFDRPAVRHYAFGGGVHRCLGSHLARIELRVALTEWHRRIPEYHIPEDIELQFATMLRQVEHVPLVFDTVTG